jgi:hypothetical protein
VVASYKAMVISRLQCDFPQLFDQSHKFPKVFLIFNFKASEFLSQIPDCGAIIAENTALAVPASNQIRRTPKPELRKDIFCIAVAILGPLTCFYSASPDISISLPQLWIIR